MSESNVLEHRHEFVLLFDVVHGNPNGDPDAGNAPRIDPETGIGLVTDVCLKRKIRNYVSMTRQAQPPHDIYVKDRGILAREQRKAYQALSIDAQDSPNKDARAWMCKNYFDVRTFGAVMSTGKAPAEESEEASNKAKKANLKMWNCGQVRGPVQLSFAQSVSPIFSHEHTITRVALTNADDVDRGSSGDDGEDAVSGQMGRKHTVPYGLYRTHIYVSPFLADDTGFSTADLDLLIESFKNLFELDRSASRGEMTVRGLFQFEHDAKLGNAPAHKLFELIRVTPKNETKPARSVSDFEIAEPPETGAVPEGVTYRKLV
ncbi:MAG: type I-C CRISPR-associated protein Cas7/Csd2 [Bryobacteraceae bacterium]